MPTRAAHGAGRASQFFYGGLRSEARSPPASRATRAASASRAVARMFCVRAQHGAFARHQQADDPEAAGLERVLIPVEQRLEKMFQHGAWL